MSRIDDLIAEHCPDGVQYKALGEVGEFVRGNGLQKKDFVAVGFPCIHYGQIYTFYGTSASTTKSFITPELASRLKQAQKGDLVVTTTSENIEDVCTAVAWLGAEPIAIGGHACVYSHTLDPLFAAYFFQTEQFEAQKRKFVTGTKVKDIKLSDLARIRIAVPPLEIQREIAAILEKMERLEAELEAELEARRIQYAHYRDSLLTFAERERVRWAKLSEVASYARGITYPKSAEVVDVSGLGVIRANNIDVRSSRLVLTDLKRVDRGVRVRPDQMLYAGDIVMSAASGSREHVGKVAFVSEDREMAIGGFMAVLRARHPMRPRFLFHLLACGAFGRWLDSTISSTTINNLSAKLVGGYQVPIPSLPEQDRIVAVLDTFDALVNDLSSGLPAELAARRRQYAFYRDRLLTFEEAAS